MYNPYLPFKAIIKDIVEIGVGVKLFKVIPEKSIAYLPGQFFMVSCWGAGEIPISVTSTPGLQKHLEFGIKRVGQVTTALHQLKTGEAIWVRGPYGNGFNPSQAIKKDILFIAGGIGLLPLRSLINLVLLNKEEYGKLFLLYGSKSSSEILFEKEIKEWGKKGGVRPFRRSPTTPSESDGQVAVVLTVDVGEEGWEGNVGLVTVHLDKIEMDFKDAWAYICGPEIMTVNVIKKLSLMGMPDSRMVLTLEGRMKCGVGKCGQCYLGPNYICVNGPVYSYEELNKCQNYRR